MDKHTPQEELNSHVPHPGDQYVPDAGASIRWELHKSIAAFDRAIAKREGEATC